MKILFLFFCLFYTVNAEEEQDENAISEIFFNRHSVKAKIDDHLLTEKWQDYVLANAVLANYLNILMVHASKSDFSLLKQSNHCTIYVKTPNSFRKTVGQLSDNVRSSLVSLYQDFNRMQAALDNFPTHLQTILLLITKGSNQTINRHLSNQIEKGERLANESLIILQDPRIKTQEIKYLIDELESLVLNVSSDYVIQSQVEDVKTQWMLFNDLFTQVTIKAEDGIHDFLYQFNWALQQFGRLNVTTYRDLIINLLKPKVMDIARTIDLLKIISETSVQISLDYINEKMADNMPLIFLTNEQERTAAIKKHRYELQPVLVKFARIALQKHNDFLERTKNRGQEYEKFLNEMTENDLDVLLSIS